MSETAEVVRILEARLLKLFSRFDQLDQTSAALRSELQQQAEVIQRQTEEIESLKARYETLRIANSLLGSDENKKDTKLKINSLIREIDYCIAQLSD